MDKNWTETAQSADNWATTKQSGSGEQCQKRSLVQYLDHHSETDSFLRNSAKFGNFAAKYIKYRKIVLYGNRVLLFCASEVKKPDAFLVSPK